jgi:hypothetical protein
MKETFRSGDMFESKLRVVSIGVAAENKALNSNKIPIWPVEMMPAGDGEIREILTETELSGVDKNNVEYTAKINSSSTLTASWLPHGTNRVTSPDIRRGEQVLIWQYADVDMYYWTPMGLDDDLRRLETVIYAWSATKDEAVELDLASNMYTLEVSTHGKHITLHTTMADGEPFEYTFQLDTKNGKFFITDQVGNTLTLDSAKTQITAINKDLTEVTLIKTTMYGYAKDEIKVKTDDYLQATAGGDITAVAGGSMHVTVDGDFNQHVKGSYNLTVDGAENKNVGGGGTLQYGAAMTVLAGGPIALDGAGVDMMSGLAGPASPTPPAPPKDGGGAPDPVPEGGGPEGLPEEYSVENTAAVREKAGRFAALDEQSEVSSTPAVYPEDTKPADFDGAAKTTSDLTDTETPTPSVSCSTVIGNAIDYDMMLGETGYTIGDLSAYALFPHRIAPQGGLSSHDIVCNLQALAENILVPLAAQYPGFRINSAFRKGSGRSQHNSGQGTDIQNDAWTPAKYMEVAEWIAANLPCDQLIFEHGNSIWLHISFDPTKTSQRGQLLTMLNGNYEPGLVNYYA